MKVKQKQSLFCSRCKADTEHVVLYVDQREETHGEGHFSLDHTINRGFMECTVCERPKVRLNVLTYPLDEETNLSIPPEPTRQIPAWIGDIPADLREALMEVHGAFANRYYWIVTSGVKTLIEMFAVERIGRVGDFEAKLHRLHGEGYLSDIEVLLVRQVAETGFGATERRKRPTERQCIALLDIAEHLLQKLTFGAHAETLGRVVALNAKAGK